MAESKGAESEFVYVTFIRTTPEKLWRALSEPEFTRQILVRDGAGMRMEAGRIRGRSSFPTGAWRDSGEVVEIDPPRKLVLKWRHELFPEMTGEGYSRMTYELEPHGETVKLTLTHEMDKKESKFIKAVANGWPMILGQPEEPAGNG